MPAETKPNLWIFCRPDRDDYSTVITPTVRRGRSFLLLTAEREFKKEHSLQPTGITAHSRFTYMPYRLITLSEEKCNLTETQNLRLRILTLVETSVIHKILLFNIFPSRLTRHSNNHCCGHSYRFQLLVLQPSCTWDHKNCLTHFFISLY